MQVEKLNPETEPCVAKRYPSRCPLSIAFYSPFKKDIVPVQCENYDNLVEISFSSVVRCHKFVLRVN